MRKHATRRALAKYWNAGLRDGIRDEYLIVDGGKLAGAGAHSYTVKK